MLATGVASSAGTGFLCSVSFPGVPVRQTILRLPEPRSVKQAYVARRFDMDVDVSLIRPGQYRPKAGDLVLATVTHLGFHGFMEVADGRRATLYVGDDLLMVYGARYAPDEFEADVPGELADCHLIAKGGLAGYVLSRHASVAPATRVRPIGVVARPDGTPWNLADLTLGEPPAVLRAPRTVFVVGTSMNSGKSTAMSGLIRGLTMAGLPVGAAKVTGTASGNDPFHYRDAGAIEVLDFTDAGWGTTYQAGVDRLLQVVRDLHAHLAARGAEAIVIEIADGILQPETRAILGSETLRSLADAVMFTASDSSGALLGVQWLRSAGLPTVAVSGLLTVAPLAVAEVRSMSDVPVYSALELEAPHVALQLVGAEYPIDLVRASQAPQVG